MLPAETTTTTAGWWCKHGCVTTPTTKRHAVSPVLVTTMTTKTTRTTTTRNHDITMATNRSTHSTVVRRQCVCDRDRGGRAMTGYKYRCQLQRILEISPFVATSMTDRHAGLSLHMYPLLNFLAGQSRESTLAMQERCHSMSFTLIFYRTPVIETKSNNRNHTCVPYYSVAISGCLKHIIRPWKRMQIFNRAGYPIVACKYKEHLLVQGEVESIYTHWLFLQQQIWYWWNWKTFSCSTCDTEEALLGFFPGLWERADYY